MYFLLKKQKSANQVTEFVLRQIKVMCIGKFLCKEEATEKQKLLGISEAGVSSNASQFWPLLLPSLLVILGTASSVLRC